MSRHAGRAKDRRPTYAPQNLKARPVRDLGCRLLEVDWGSIEHAVLQAVLTTAPDPVPRIVEWVDVGEAQRSDRADLRDIFAGFGPMEMRLAAG
jgi:hypothetical protein